MTRAEILTMPAGREMDALIAEKVIGVDVKKRKDGVLHYLFWPYSTQMTSTLLIIDAMEGKVTRFSTHKHSDGYGVFLNSDFEVRAETLPLAICRAALLTVPA